MQTKRWTDLPQHQTSLNVLLHFLCQMLHIGLKKCHSNSETFFIYKKTAFILLEWADVRSVRRVTHLEVMNVEWFFKNISGVRTNGDACGGCQITAVSPHSLHHKDPPLGPCGRLLDLITALQKTNTHFRSIIQNRPK